MSETPPGKGDLACCAVCREYFPVSHPGYVHWHQSHSRCALREWSSWENRMELFENRGGKVLHLAWKNDIPDDYACRLGDLELLAFVGLAGEE